MLAAAAVQEGNFLPNCPGTEQYGWPRFESREELEANAGWSAYWKEVYGELPSQYPVCTYDFWYINVEAWIASGLNGTREVVDSKAVKEGDLFGSVSTTGGGLAIYHGKWEPVPNNTWVEVTHAVFPTELEGSWVWRSPGSGVWYNMGRTLVFPTPADPAKTHAEAIAFLTAHCSKKISPYWPQLESDIFGSCARELGYDSIQFQPQDGQSPMGTFGLTGLTEAVLVNVDGQYGCGTADPKQTPLRQGWKASSQCECENTPIPPDCGLMPFPPYPINITGAKPPLCAAQAQNKSVPCNTLACKHMTCNPKAR